MLQRSLRLSIKRNMHKLKRSEAASCSVLAVKGELRRLLTAFWFGKGGLIALYYYKDVTLYVTEDLEEDWVRDCLFVSCSTRCCLLLASCISYLRALLVHFVVSAPTGPKQILIGMHVIYNNMLLMIWLPSQFKQQSTGLSVSLPTKRHSLNTATGRLNAASMKSE